MFPAVSDLARVTRPGTGFVVCQNGLGNEEYIAEALGSESVVRVIINYGGYLVDHGHIRMSFFRPPNYVGSLTPMGEPLARQMADIMTSAGLDTQFAGDIKGREWEKTILNASMNPVCALASKTMKEVMDFESTRLLVRAILRESIAIALANEVAFGEGFEDHCIRYLEMAGFHPASMQVDLDRGTPTEIDWLNGKLVEFGRKCGLEASYNFAATALVRGRESKSTVRQRLDVDQ
jgi:2-dehydropantoate 2-reductase